MTETQQSVAADEQATADAPERNAPEAEDAPGSMPTAEAVAEGSAYPGESSMVAFSDRGVVSLAPAPMPQFEMVRAQGYGGEPVYPEGHEDMLSEGLGAVGVQNYQADQEIVAANPAIAELFETTDAGEANSGPSQAGPSSESSVIASGESENETSNPQTGAPAANQPAAPAQNAPASTQTAAPAQTAPSSTTPAS